MDFVVFQAVVTTTVDQISSNSNESRNGSDSSNQGENQGHQRMCSYKEFMNSKPRTYHVDDRVVTLTRWFLKLESIFEICARPSEFNVKYVACTLVDSAMVEQPR